MGTNCSEAWIKIRSKDSFYENALENSFCKTSAILFMLNVLISGSWTIAANGAALRTPCPDNKVREANMGPIWGRQDPGGPHVGPMNFAILIQKHNPTQLGLQCYLLEIHYLNEYDSVIIVTIIIHES